MAKIHWWCRIAFYKAKAGEAGVNGNEDPNAADTKWDMANPTELMSHLETDINLGASTSGTTC